MAKHRWYPPSGDAWVVKSVKLPQSLIDKLPQSEFSPFCRKLIREYVKAQEAPTQQDIPQQDTQVAPSSTQEAPISSPKASLELTDDLIEAIYQRVYPLLEREFITPDTLNKCLLDVANKHLAPFLTTQTNNIHDKIEALSRSHARILEYIKALKYVDNQILKLRG